MIDQPPGPAPYPAPLGTTWRHRVTGAVYQLVIDPAAPHGCTMFGIDLDGRDTDQSVEAGDAVWLREHFEQVTRAWIPADAAAADPVKLITEVASAKVLTMTACELMVMGLARDARADGSAQAAGYLEMAANSIRAGAPGSFMDDARRALAERRAKLWITIQR